MVTCMPCSHTINNVFAGTNVRTSDTPALKARLSDSICYEMAASKSYVLVSQCENNVTKQTLQNKHRKTNVAVDPLADTK